LELNVVLDKSSFHGLSARELDAARLCFHQTTTPVLVFEVLGDLTSARRRRKSPPEFVAGLSRKLTDSAGTINDHFFNACLFALKGGQFSPPHATLPDNYFIAPSGGMVIEESPLLGRLRCWACGRFTEQDAELSALWRHATRSLSFHDFEKRLTREHVLLPAPNDRESIVKEADKVLAIPSLQSVVLQWLLDFMGADELLRSAVLLRWSGAAQPLLRHFAPYAYHCARVLLSLAIAVRHHHLNWKSTHVVDAQYLYYLPFCEVFVSEDHLHRLLGPQLLDGEQSFVTHSDLKKALRVLADFHEGTGPENADFLVIDALWRKHRGRLLPRPRRMETAHAAGSL
jgi:hypothetical protein